MITKEELRKVFEKHTPQTEMDEDATIVLFQMMKAGDKELDEDMFDVDKNSKIYLNFYEIFESLPAKVFLQRMKAFSTLSITMGAFIVLLCQMNVVGRAVMYFHYLDCILEPNKLITMQTLAEVFPNGYFSEEQLHSIWMDLKNLSIA